MSTPTRNGTPLTDQELQPCKSSQRASTCTATRHGDANAYNQGCRCPDARASATRRRTTHKLRVLAGHNSRVDPTGTRRRIHALIAHGWPSRTLATHLGVSVTALGYYSRRRRVLASTAAKVAALYDKLADTPGPSQQARAQARARKWLGPIWWDDDTIDDPNHDPLHVERQARRFYPDTPRRGRPTLVLTGPIDPVIVDRLIGGSVADATPPERYAAYTQLRDRGNNATAAAELLHLSSSARRTFAQTYARNHLEEDTA